MCICVHTNSFSAAVFDIFLIYSYAPDYVSIKCRPLFAFGLKKGGGRGE